MKYTIALQHTTRVLYANNITNIIDKTNTIQLFSFKALIAKGKS